MKLLSIFTIFNYIGLAYNEVHILGKMGQCTRQEFQNMINQSSSPFDVIRFDCSEKNILIDNTILLSKSITIDGAGITIISRIPNYRPLFQVSLNPSPSNFATVIVKNIGILLTTEGSIGIFANNQNIHIIISSVQFSTIRSKYKGVVTERSGNVMVSNSTFSDCEEVVFLRRCRKFSFVNNHVVSTQRRGGRIVANLGNERIGNIDFVDNKVENVVSNHELIRLVNAKVVNVVGNIVNNVEAQWHIFEVCCLTTLNFNRNVIQNVISAGICARIKWADHIVAKTNIFKNNTSIKNLYLGDIGHSVQFEENKFISNTYTESIFAVRVMRFIQLKNNLFFNNTVTGEGEVYINHVELAEMNGNSFLKNLVRKSVIRLKNVRRMRSEGDFFAANENENVFFHETLSQIHVMSAVFMCSQSSLINNNSRNNFQIENSILGALKTPCNSPFVTNSVFMKDANEISMQNCESNVIWKSRRAMSNICSHFNNLGKPELSSMNNILENLMI